MELLKESMIGINKKYEKEQDREDDDDEDSQADTNITDSYVSNNIV